MPSIRIAIVLAACLVGAMDANATVLTYEFDTVLQSGPLAGTAFPGTISFDNAAATGIGQEYFTLSSIDFTLLGRHFTRGDVSQGGQAITQDGTLSYFTSAFELLSAPPTLSTVAFGFGGPGIVGYLTLLPRDGGEGEYTLSGPIGVSEPTSLTLAAAALAMFAVARRRMRQAARQA